MKDIFISDEQLYKKKLKRWRIAFFTLLFVFIAFIYVNFNYLAFKILISKFYIFEDSLKEIYDESLGEENFRSYLKDFDYVVMDVFTDKIREKNDDRYTYLYTPQQFEYSNENRKTVALEFFTEELDAETVYVKLPNISKETKKQLFESVKTLEKYKNIIVDLRDNSGGDLYYLYKMESLFLDKDVTLGFEKTRIDLFTNEIINKKNKKLEFENIVLLQNGNTASAAEGFITALKENSDNVLIIGETSFGKGIGQFTMPLTAGYAVKATILNVETPKNNSIHRVGIEPDIVYDKDDIIDFSHSKIIE